MENGELNISDDLLENRITEENAIAYLESIDNTSFCNIFESNDIILDNEFALLEALNNMDFMDAINNKAGYVNEADNVVSNDNAKKAALSHNISVVISNSKNAIKQTGAKANDEALTLLTSDKNTYKKYTSALRTYKNLDGFEGINNFSFPNIKVSRYIDMVGDMSDITRAYRKAVSDILDARSKEKIISVMKLYSVDMGAIMDSAQQRSTKAFEKEQTWNPSRQDVMFIIKFINNPSRIACSIADEVRSCVDNLSKINKIANTAYTSCETRDGSLYVTMMNAIYNCSSLAARNISQRFNIFKDLTIREIAAYRRAAMVCGRYASKTKDGIKESVELQKLHTYAIGESSDAYVFRRFEDI